jgi:hypothetical protein
MIVDKIWKLTNAVRVGLNPRSSHTHTQATSQDTRNCSDLAMSKRAEKKST